MERDIGVPRMPSIFPSSIYGDRKCKLFQSLDEGIPTPDQSGTIHLNFLAQEKVSGGSHANTERNGKRPRTQSLLLSSTINQWLNLLL